LEEVFGTLEAAVQAAPAGHCGPPPGAPAPWSPSASPSAPATAPPPRPSCAPPWSAGTSATSRNGGSVSPLAGLLLEAGDNGRRPGLYGAAATEVRRAVHLAADRPEAHFVAGVIEQRLCGQTADVRLRMFHRRRAKRFLTRCRQLAPAHRGTGRALRLLEEDDPLLRGSRLSGAVLVTIASALLAVTWTDCIWKHHVTVTMATTLTPCPPPLWPVACSCRSWSGSHAVVALARGSWANRCITAIRLVRLVCTQFIRFGLVCLGGCCGVGLAR
jgi:hypothetical protein